MHAVLLAELGAIILALGLLGRLAGRYGQSPIPLYLLAGLAFGHGGLLPLSASEDFVVGPRTKPRPAALARRSDRTARMGLSWAASRCCRLGGTD